MSSGTNELARLQLLLDFMSSGNTGGDTIISIASGPRLLFQINGQAPLSPVINLMDPFNFISPSVTPLFNLSSSGFH